jgi:primosomal protein N' (replication factor Y)
MQPGNEFFKFIKERNYNAFLRHEINLRKVLNLPPFCDIITIGFAGKNSKNVYNFADEFLNTLKNLIKIEGNKPQPANVFKLNSNFRYKIIIKQKNNATFRKLLKNIILKFLNSHSNNTIRIFVDPYSCCEL